MRDCSLPQSSTRFDWLRKIEGNPGVISLSLSLSLPVTHSCLYVHVRIRDLIMLKIVHCPEFESSSTSSSNYSFETCKSKNDWLRKIEGNPCLISLILWFTLNHHIRHVTMLLNYSIWCWTCVQSFVNWFVIHEKRSRDLDIAERNERNHKWFCFGHGSLLNFGKLIKGYLAEIAYDFSQIGKSIIPINSLD